MEIVVSEQEVLNQRIVVGQQSNSLNFAFGMFSKKDESFDILNNQYIEPVVYQMSKPGNLMKQLPKSLVRRCTKEEMLKIVKEDVLHWYPDALCIDDKSELILQGALYTKTANLPLISIVECKNYTASDRCKPSDKIAEFVNNHPFFYIQQ